MAPVSIELKPDAGGFWRHAGDTEWLPITPAAVDADGALLGLVTVDPEGNVLLSGPSVLVNGQDIGSQNGGSMPQPVLAAVNGTVKDYDPPGGIDNVDTLLIDVAAKPWQANHFYSVNAHILGGGLGPKLSQFARGTTGDSEPDWSTDGSEVIEGLLEWVAVPYEGDWSADTAYTAGHTVTANGSIWQTPGGGTSGSVEPDWSSADLGETVVDNDITWYNGGPVSTWQPNHVYSIMLTADSLTAYNPHVLPTAPGAWAFRMVKVDLIEGTSGDTEPDWPVPGGFAIDGDLLWDFDDFASGAALEITGIKAPASVPRTLTLILFGDTSNGSVVDDAATELDPAYVSEAANRIDCGGSTYHPISNIRAGSVLLIYPEADGGWIRVEATENG